MPNTYSAGIVTAYGAAKSAGYTGTYEEFCEEQARFAENAQAVHEDREAVEATVTTFENVTVPQAVQSVTDEGTTQVGLVSNEGTTQIGAVNTAGGTQVGLVTAEGTTQIGLVQAEGTTQTGLVTTEGTTQVGLVEDKGEEVIASIPADYTDLSNNVTLLNQQIGNVNYKTPLLPGYFVDHGEIATQSATYKEVYTENYFPVIGGETLNVSIVLEQGKAQWARWIFYDKNKVYLSYNTKAQTWTQTLTFDINVPADASYMRLSFRSFDLLSDFSILHSKSYTESLNDYANSISSKIIRYNPNCLFSAHQGYDPNSTGTVSGYNKLEGYYRAAEHGFDIGETDIKFTLDDVPVCCHDSSFVDATSGDTVVIASTNYADLITHDYYGGTIASFENVLKACKNTGLMIAIDQLFNFNSSKWDIIFPLIKKYGMSDRVYWLFTMGSQSLYTAVHAVFQKAKYELLASSGVSISDMITYANSIANTDEEIIVGVNYGSVTANDVAAYAQTCNTGVKMGVWTIPQHIPTCLQYMPYVGLITTNRTSYNDVWNYGLR